MIIWDATDEGQLTVVDPLVCRVAANVTALVGGEAEFTCAKEIRPWSLEAASSDASVTFRDTRRS